MQEVYKVDWYRVALPQRELEELNRPSDWRGLLQASGHLGLVVTTGFLSVYAWYHFHWALFLACLFLHGTVCAFLANAGHELVHGTVFNNRYLNDFFLYCFSFIRWFPPEYYWGYHTAHHRFTLYPDDDKDPELFPYADEPGELKRVTLREFLAREFVNPFNLVNTIKRNVRQSFGIFKDDWEQRLFADETSRRKVIIWARVLLAGHAAILIASLYSGYWIIPVVVSLTPCYGGWLQMLCNHPQHAGLKKNVPDFRLSCRTMYLNPVLEFLYWHMNFHVEHHMYAAVPCYRLRNLHETIKHELPPALAGLAATWQEIIAIQYRQKQEPGYVHTQRLPGAATQAAQQEIGAPERTTRQVKERNADNPGRVWECSICGFVYSESLGLPEAGIPPGTAWEDVPEDWVCPDCGTAKSAFEMKEVR